MSRNVASSVRGGQAKSLAAKRRGVLPASIIAIVVVVLFVIMLLTGHSPARHAPSGEAGGQGAALSVVEEHAPPEGGRGEPLLGLDPFEATGSSSCPYSPECVEGKFCELHHDGVLRSSCVESSLEYL